jgi:hypothetical protein
VILGMMPKKHSSTSERPFCVGSFGGRVFELASGTLSPPAWERQFGDDYAVFHKPLEALEDTLKISNTINANTVIGFYLKMRRRLYKAARLFRFLFDQLKTASSSLLDGIF